MEKDAGCSATDEYDQEVTIKPASTSEKLWDKELTKKGVIKSSRVKINKTNIFCIATTTNNSESICYLSQCGQTYVILLYS